MLMQICELSSVVSAMTRIRELEHDLDQKS
jgi:hypothetical protein